MADSPRDWLSAKQTAHFLGIDPGTLRNWRKRHTSPPYHRIGKQYRYRREDIDAFLAARRCE